MATEQIATDAPVHAGDASSAMRANQAGVAAAFAGAIALVVAVFLPLADNTTSFARIAQNTLIQNGGWPLIALGLGAAVAAFRGSTGKHVRGTFLILGVLAIAFVVYVATEKSLRTLYPIVNGTPDSTQPGTLAAVGIGVYVAAIGAGLVLLASFFAPTPIAAAAQTVAAVEPWPVSPPTAGATKRCPDCAETILEDARVCKHCGYRFGEEARQHAVDGV